MKPNCGAQEDQLNNVIGGLRSELEEAKRGCRMLAENATEWKNRAEERDATNMVLRGAVTAVAAQRDELLAALEAAARQFDFTVGALAKGRTVSVGSLQNCAAAAWAAISKAKGNT